MHGSLANRDFLERPSVFGCTFVSWEVLVSKILDAVEDLIPRARVKRLSEGIHSERGRAL